MSLLMTFESSLQTRKLTRAAFFIAVAVDDAAAGRMLVVERWQDQASLTSHLETHRTATFLEKWMTRVKSDVLKYDASNERSLMD